MKNKRFAASVLAVFVLCACLLGANAGAQQCPRHLRSYPARWSGQEPCHVVVAGATAYLWDANYNPFPSSGRLGWRHRNLNIIDISDSEGPRIIADIAVAPIAFDETGITRYTFDDGLTITDVSDPIHPVDLSFDYAPERGPGPMAVSDGRLYLAGSQGLTIHDVSDPEAPFEIGELAREWFPTTMVAADGLIFVGIQADGFRVIDVSDAANPQEIGSWASAIGVRELVVSGNFVYAACGREGLRVVDVSDPANPAEVESVFKVEEAWGISISDEIAAVALGTFGTWVFDVSNILEPEILTVLPAEGPVWDVALSGRTSYIAVGTAGETIPPLGRVEDQPESHSTGGFGSFQIVDLADPTTPVERGAFGLRPKALDVDVKDGIEYFALGDVGVSIGPPPEYALVMPDPFDTPGYAVAITPYDHYALVADLHKGLRIIDVSDLENLLEIGFYDTSGQAHEVVTSGHLAYVADGDAGLRIIDISMPTNPIELGAIDTPGDAIDVAVSEGIAYVADGPEGLRIIDVSDPESPIDLGTSGGLLDARAVAVAGDRMFVVSRFVNSFLFNQFFFFDISDPTDPNRGWVNRTIIDGDPTDIEISGSYVYVTARTLEGWGKGSLGIYDTSNLAKLKRVAEWREAYDVSGLFVANGRAYLAAEHDGVPILDVRCLTTYWVDIVANLPGRHGSHWHSDIIINNEHRPRGSIWKSSDANPYGVEFILHTVDGDFTLESAIVPEGQGVFEDIVGAFGYEGKGALEIRTQVPVSVFSRVYNRTHEGTFGAFAPGYNTSDSLGRLEVGWLYGLRQEAGKFRTNISVTDTSGTGAGATITLYRTDGTPFHQFWLNVPPGMAVQDLEPFKDRAGLPNIGWGFAKVEGEGIIASATVIDSRTNDAAIVPMEITPGVPWYH